MGGDGQEESQADSAPAYCLLQLEQKNGLKKDEQNMKSEGYFLCEDWVLGFDAEIPIPALSFTNCKAKANFFLNSCHHG